jgi:hypothetical protein
MGNLSVVAYCQQFPWKLVTPVNQGPGVSTFLNDVKNQFGDCPGNLLFCELSLQPDDPEQDLGYSAKTDEGVPIIALNYDKIMDLADGNYDVAMLLACLVFMHELAHILDDFWPENFSSMAEFLAIHDQYLRSWVFELCVRVELCLMLDAKDLAQIVCEMFFTVEKVYNARKEPGDPGMPECTPCNQFR